LRQLLAGCPSIDRLLCSGDEIPHFDTHAPLLSLPRILKTSLDTIPIVVPYLFADAGLVAQWQAQLAEVQGFRIGINWRGRTGSGAYRQRDIPLDCFASLAQIPGVR